MGRAAWQMVNRFLALLPRGRHHLRVCSGYRLTEAWVATGPAGGRLLSRPHPPPVCRGVEVPRPGRGRGTALAPICDSVKSYPLPAERDTNHYQTALTRHLPGKTTWGGNRPCAGGAGALRSPALGTEAGPPSAGTLDRGACWRDSRLGVGVSRGQQAGRLPGSQAAWTVNRQKEGQFCPPPPDGGLPRPASAALPPPPQAARTRRMAAIAPARGTAHSGTAAGPALRHLPRAPRPPPEKKNAGPRGSSLVLFVGLYLRLTFVSKKKEKRAERGCHLFNFERTRRV